MEQKALVTLMEACCAVEQAAKAIQTPPCCLDHTASGAHCILAPLPRQDILQPHRHLFYLFTKKIILWLVPVSQQSSLIIMQLTLPNRRGSSCMEFWSFPDVSTWLVKGATGTGVAIHLGHGEMVTVVWTTQLLRDFFFRSMSTCLNPCPGSTGIWWEITLLDINTTWWIQIVCDGWYKDKRLCVHHSCMVTAWAAVHSHKEHMLRIFSISVYNLIFWIIPPLLALWNTNNCHSETVKSHMCVLLVGCMLLCSILLED